MRFPCFHIETLDHLSKSSLAKVLHYLVPVSIRRVDHLVLAQEKLVNWSCGHLGAVLLDVLQYLVASLLVVLNVLVMPINVLSHVQKTVRWFFKIALILKN